MNQYIKIAILTLLITICVNVAIYVPRMIILSNLEYKRTFVHSVYVGSLNGKSKEINLGVVLEISKYNAWLARMKWLRSQGLRVWIPVDIDKEIFYEQ